jgi:hypothetical protein
VLPGPTFFPWSVRALELSAPSPRYSLIPIRHFDACGTVEYDALPLQHESGSVDVQANECAVKRLRAQSKPRECYVGVC